MMHHQLQALRLSPEASTSKHSDDKQDHHACDAEVSVRALSNGKVYGDGFNTGFYKFKDSKEFADVIVSTPHGEYHLHSLLLAYRSDFFHKALTSDFVESRNRRINLQFDKALDAWPQLVDFFYTDLVYITEENVMPLLALARQLLVSAVDKYCLDFVRERLSVDNCLVYLKEAVKFDIDELLSECVALAARGFHFLYDGDVAGLPVSVVLDILQQEDITIHCEHQVVHFVTKYLATTAVDADAVSSICKQIRLVYLDNDTLVELGQQGVIPRDLLLEGCMARLAHMDRDTTTLSAISPPPRKTYCSNLKYHLPGGSTTLDVDLDLIWDQLVKVMTVRVSGVMKGDAANVLSTDPEAWFETNDAMEPPPWIEVQLPHNVSVTHFPRYTFAHGHSRSGYYRPRNWKTSIAESAAGPLTDVPTRTGTTEQFEVHVLPAHQHRSWQVLRLTSNGVQEDGVHRLCIRNLKAYGTARVDLMKQAGGFVVDAPLRYSPTGSPPLL